MNTYTKLWHDLVTSSIWTTADQATKVVWITMLALKDRHNTVTASIPGLARTAGVTIEECQSALNILSSPDKFSRTEDFEGRRILKTDHGWLILNGEKYQNKISGDERREYLRIKKQEERQRRKAEVNTTVDSQQVSTNVNNGQQRSTPVTVTVSCKSLDQERDLKNMSTSPTIGGGVGEPGVSTPDPSLAPLVGGEEKEIPETSSPKKTKTPHPIVLRINALFGRRETTKWSEKEKKALVKLMPIPEEDLQLIEAYYGYGPMDPDYRRRDICTLLNNWPGEVDRARKFDPNKAPTNVARNVSLNTTPAMRREAEDLIRYYNEQKTKKTETP